MQPIEEINEQTIKDFLLENRKLAYCPSSVYRLQMNASFTFRDARSILPYLSELGIEAVYLSPITKALPGSLHGYDVTDPTQLNPELGSRADFESFCDRLRELKMGVILDTVPNHMGIAGSHNALWMDVLENGPSSIYSRFFDIDWKPVKAELENKVLIPILGDLYGKVLDRQEIQVEFNGEKGELRIRYFDNYFPTDPQTYPLLLEFQIETLKEQSKDGKDEEVAEYLSVITAFKKLPGRTETDPEKVQERNREKEIAKKRLAELMTREKRIKEFVESRVQIFNGTQGDPKSFDLLDHFLDQQGYRMAFWRTAAEEINYRRFFDINQLAAIRMEDDKVFEFYHRLIFEWISEGRVHGLRIDHPDGLYDPPVYFRRLQRKYLKLLAEKEWIPAKDKAASKDGNDFEKSLSEKIEKILEGEEFASANPLYVVAEKILDRKELLPENWSVHGTVGYDFLNVLNGVFVDQARQKDFSELYESFMGHAIDFDQLLYDKKKLFALVHMASEINTLGHRLDLISEKDRHYRDFTRNNLTLAIREVIACFPVYRTYVSPGDEAVSERDERYINIAIEKAKAKTSALNPAVYDFLKDVLLLKFDIEVTPESKKTYRDFVLRFQQITGPIMAKGLEDTSFYVYNRFVSLNEVGGDPFHFGYSKEEFHHFNKIKFEQWPYGMICSSTHDTKRSEDVRMRLNVLSEMPDEWKSALTRWAMINDKHKTLIKSVSEPRRNTEYFIYQTLLGAWPEAGLGGKGLPPFADRIWEYVLKAVREAKTYTNWVNPNKEYEEAIRKYIYAILNPGNENNSLKDFLPFQEKISYFGKLNSLSALVLKIASPGVVDTYQGTELWSYCLVDPDNRRPVDFESRKNLFHSLHKGSHLKPIDENFLKGLISDEQGQVKLLVLAKALSFRKSCPEFFLDGDYIPLKVEGEKERNVVAFMRKKDDQRAIVIAGRFFTELMPEPGQLPLGEAIWKDTRVILPKDRQVEGALKDIFTGKMGTVHSEGGESFVRLAEIFHSLSVTILTTEA
ncbi:MAG: malto-oligosyltrehalose synthase [Candidatus Omnitrophota bacterium]